MDSKLAVPLIIAAVILGACVLGGSLLVQSSLDRGTEELGGVRAALGEFKEALQAAAQPAPSPAAAARPNRPDPNQRYTVNTKGSATKGPDSAKIKLVEFSDFQ